MPNKYGIVIHGGAGTILKEKMTPELEAEYEAMLRVSIKTGYDLLAKGASSIDAVQAAINVMEDSALFNAGKGAVFTHEGKNEQDATIMDGSTLDSGAIAGVRHIKNPINLARAVLEKSEHVLLGGEGAEKFAKLNNIELVDPKYFYTEKRWLQLEQAKEKEKSNPNFTMLDHSDHEDKTNKYGTVGAVALDQNGNLAAATSSGGMTNKKFGRIGDSAVQGAGTYANNKTCAVSTTGHGEFFIRSVTAFTVSTLMMYNNMDLKTSAHLAIFKYLADLGGTGGLVAIDKDGNIALPYNTTGMYRGYLLSDMNDAYVRIFED